jgi:hypothetical protein
MPRPLGTDLTMNRNTGAGYSSPAWTNIRGLHDVKLNIQPGAMVKSSDRSVNIDTEVPTRYKVEVDASAFWNGGPGLTALRAAFLNGMPIELAVLYGPAATSKKGVRAEWAVTQFPIDFPLGDNQKIAIKLQPHADYTNAPLFYTDATTTVGTAETISTKKIGAAACVCASGGTPIGAAMEIKLNLQPGALIDSSDRDSLFDVVKPTRFKFEPEFTFLWNPTNTQLMAIYTAATTNAPIELYILDGAYATSGSWGVHSEWAVNGFPIDAKLKDGQQVTVKLTPHGDGTVAPAFYTVP